MVNIDIDKLARLARLYLEKEAKEKIAPSLPKIIEYFQTIKHLGQKPGPCLPQKFPCPRRKEEAEIHKEIRCEEKFLKTLPNYQDGYFQVPHCEAGRFTPQIRE